MRFVLWFFMSLCFFMGMLAAIGAGAAWGGDDYSRGLVGVLVSLVFVSLGAHYAWRLGSLERERRLFFPRRRWWQW